MPISRPKVGGANSVWTAGDHEFRTPNLKTLKMGDLFKFKARPLDWHKQLLILSKLAADLNRMAGVNVQALTGDLSLGAFDKVFQQLDPDGANRDVILPEEGLASETVYFITNTGTENLVVKYPYDSDTPGAVIGTLQGGASAWYTSDGSSWSFVEVTASTGGSPGRPGWLGPW